ncbi:uncharacterized protein TNCT_336641, partial [Trichonephila clavata]
MFFIGDKIRGLSVRFSVIFILSCSNHFRRLGRVMTGSSGMERISSAPRLSFSSQDVFNLRNHNLSQLSRSTPGIYSPQRKGLDLSLQQINLIAGTRTPPKSILIKPKEEPVLEKVPEDEKEDKISFYKLRLELQFTAFVFLCFILVIVIPLSMIIV